MSVYRRPGQKDYSYDFRHRGNRFSGSTGATSRREAEKVEERLKAAARATTAERNAPLSFAAASTLYWQEIGQYASTAGETERHLAWLQKHIGKATPIAAIDDRLLARIIAIRRGERVPQQGRKQGRKPGSKHGKQDRLVSNATVNRTVLEPLRAILLRAAQVWDQQTGKINWKAHRLAVKPERVREATPAEEAGLKTAIRDDYVPALAFALLTGCRRAEIVGLAWTDVDFFNRRFTVTGKGDRSRSIPMTGEVYDLLWSLKDHHPVAVFTYVCRRPGSGRGQVKGQRYPITIAGFKTAWRRGRARAGIADFRFHDTRHTAGTRLLRHTGNLRLAQKLLGHADIATTTRYAHAAEADLRAGLEAVATAHKPATESPTETATGAPTARRKPLTKKE